jgi:hypothetical protein
MEFSKDTKETEFDFEGLTKEKALKIEEEMKEREIPLHVFPKKPEKSYPLDKKKFEDYKNSLKNEDEKKVLQHMEDNVQHISMTQFEEKLKECVTELNKSLKNKTFSVGFACGKSSQWVSGLALKTLETLPTSWFPLKSSYKDPVQSDLGVEEVEEKDIVLFDDISYSGKQITGYIKGIEKQLMSKKMVKNLFLIIPFITKQAFDEIQNLQESYKDQLNITLITSEQGTIKTMREILDNFEKSSKVKNAKELALKFFDNEGFNPETNISEDEAERDLNATRSQCKSMLC